MALNDDQSALMMENPAVHALLGGADVLFSEAQRGFVQRRR